MTDFKAPGAPRPTGRPAPRRKGSPLPDAPDPSELVPKGEADGIPVWCAHDAILPIDQLRVNPRNPNTHPDIQIELLSNLLLTTGWRGVVTISTRSGKIVTGHGRRMAALRAGLREVPVDYQHFNNDAEELQHLIADNRIPELPKWDARLLTGGLDDLAAEGYPEDAGFTAKDVAALRRETGAEGENGWPVDFQAFPVETIEAQILEEIAPFVEETIAAGLITVPMAMGQFNRLCRGDQAGYYISALFNPHRFAIDCGVQKTGLIAASSTKTWQKATAKFISRYYEGDLHPMLYPKYVAIGMAGIQVANEFKPWIARDAYRRFVKPGDDVLDPCHGWGGRVIGWLAANLGGEYVGFDPAQKTSDGVKRLIKFLGTSRSRSTARVECLPFEDAKLDAGRFGFALTSPPYFDTERYGASEQDSATRYGEYDRWVGGFYKPLLLNTARALKKGGRFLLNVGDKKYPLSQTARDIMGAAGWKFELLHDFAIGGSGIGERANTDETTGEPFILFYR